MVVGMPRATSSACVGPERTTMRLTPSAVRASSLMRACVRSQRPLVSETVSVSGAINPANDAQTSPKNLEGEASTTISAPATASARSAVQRMDAGSSTPGR